MVKENIYKLKNVKNVNIRPGDLKRSPDDCLSETVVFIDAGFLSKLSEYFGGGKHLKYDIIQFCKNISEKQKLICKQIYYYTSPPFQSNMPSKEESERYKRYENFRNALCKENIISVREGRCQRLKCDERFVFGQKGVDALIIIDLISIPLEHKNINKIILIANDSDFVPVINKLTQLKISVILYTYYSKKRQSSFSRSNELLQSVSRYAELSKEDFLNAPLKHEENKKKQGQEIKKENNN